MSNELLSTTTLTTTPTSSEKGQKRRGRPPKNSAPKVVEHNEPTSDDSLSKTGSARKEYPIVDVELMPAKCKMLFTKLKNFYRNGAMERVVLPILKEKDPIALRHIEWLVTNYSLAFPIVYPNPTNPNGEPFNVNDSYSRYEKHWTKKLFDPNQRGPRINFTTANGELVVTTLGQMNFMMWAIQFGVIDWAVRHKKEIKDHHKMVKKQRQELIKANPNREKKRMRLTDQDKSHCLVYTHAMDINIGGQNSATKTTRTTTGLPEHIDQ
jgi:hypothetical protein